MLAGDFDRFVAIIRKLEGVYGKSIDDSTMQAWWGALRDLPFELVGERVDAHIRYGRHFPRPAELRPKDDKAREPKDDGAFQDLVRASDARLDDLWCEDRELWRKTVSPKIYELGYAKGMTEGQIAEKIRNYKPARLRNAH